MRLSIVIPAYNVEQFISKTLKSLISQTVNQFEIIVVDDGSTDNTYNIAKKILENASVIPYKVIKKKNGGVSSARNAGLYECSGDYVIFLDGDDYVSNELIESIYKCLNNYEPDIICWKFGLMKKNRRIVNNESNDFSSDLDIMNGTEALDRILYHKNLRFCTGSAAYKKKILVDHNLKYTEGCANGEDQEFNYKVLSKVKKVILIHKILLYYVQREGSISNSYDITRFQAIYAIKRAYEYINEQANDDFKNIANILKETKMIDDYLYNLQSCLEYSHKLNIQVLFNQIDDNYPGLNKEIIKIMKEYKGKDKRIIIKVKLFLFSPLLYFKLITLL